MLEFQTFVFNPFSENTFVVWDDISKEAMIIDPGCYSTEEETELDNFINDSLLDIKFLINTHCHLDHIFGNSFVKEKYNPIYLAPEKDLPLIDQFIKQAETYGLSAKPSPKPDKYLSEDKALSLGEINSEFLFTPGHTPGEFCVYFPNYKKCFTGDVLFRESIGRTDLWGGDYDILINSINKKLLTLPDDVRVYPGHGPETTIGFERVNNSFLM